MLSVDIVIVFGLLVVALALFMWEVVSFDVTALIILGTLLVTGILTPAEGLSGFSNEATITIAGMFVVSEGIRRTGALDRLGDGFRALGRRNYWLAVTVMMVVIGIVSAFINNTAAVAIFIPVILSVAPDLGVSASKLLMPLSFASMFGGVCTLIGTSTNILVSSMAEERGEAAFGLFEFAPLGVILFVVGFAYLLTAGIRLIPARREEGDLTETFQLQDYLTDIVLEPECELLGQTLDASELTHDLDLDVVHVVREGGEPSPERGETILRAGDVLRIRGSAHEINKLLERQDIKLKPTEEWFDVDLECGLDSLVEAVVAPESALEGRKLRALDLPQRVGALPLAVRHHGVLQQDALAEVRLTGGDALLMCADRDRLAELERDPSFVLVSTVGLPAYRRSKMPLALAILAGIVAATTLGLVPIVVSVLVGVVLLIVTGCLTNEEAYEAVNWQVILLLAGVIPLGIAMEKTGAAQLLAGLVVDLLGGLGPAAVLSGFFFLSMMLTNVISNQATAVLLVPICFQVADTLDVQVRPLLMAVTFAASLSFMTPVGYQTNTLIYGPGQYRFSDFARVGTPLNLLFWVIASIMIPIIWPF